MAIRKIKFLTYYILLPLVLLLSFETLLSTIIMHSIFALTDPYYLEVLRFISLTMLVIILSLSMVSILFNIVKVNPSIKRIKIKLIPMIIGQILINLALFLDLFIPFNYISIISFAGGYLLIFFMIYHGSILDIFLQIRGNESLKELYIINARDLTCLYHYNFTQKRQLKNNQNNLPIKSDQTSGDEFFSYGIEGIQKILARITQDQEEKIQSISQENSVLLLEHGSKQYIPLTYVLIAEKGQKNLRIHINNFKNYFESSYKEILMNFDQLKGNQKLIFGSFDILINDIIK